MATARTISLVAILAVTALGCSKHTTRPDEPARLAADGVSPNLNRGGDCDGLPTVPEDQRVDLYTPSFSHPTAVTNPLLPIARLDRVLLLGNSDGERLRVETTLLSRTRRIDLGAGRRVETLVSQYMSWVDGRIHEVALDWYAQDDQGAVWYLGEDVFNYEAGRIANTDGTWLAGRDGPEAMIMPADPRVPNAWRPENICGFVFEEVVATQTGVTVQGPRGSIPGALLVRELHMDGTFESKTFAPGYGEFSTGSGANLEAVALAMPIDASREPMPDALKALSRGATKIFGAAHARRWQAASEAVRKMIEAWHELQARGVPASLDEQMSDALETLEESVDSRNVAAARQASIDAARAALDLKLAYRERTTIDLAHIELWARQIVVDAEAHDRDAIRGDFASIKWIRERLAGHCPHDVGQRLVELESTAQVGDPLAANEVAERLTESLARHGINDEEPNTR